MAVVAAVLQEGGSAAQGWGWRTHECRIGVEGGELGWEWRAEQDAVMVALQGATQATAGCGQVAAQRLLQERLQEDGPAQPLALQEGGVVALHTVVR